MKERKKILCKFYVTKVPLLLLQCVFFRSICFSPGAAPEQDNISFGCGSSSGTSNGDSEQHQPQLPEVVGGSGKYLKACSKGLTLKSNANKGRFVVANEAFRPGDVILVEKAYVSVLLPQHYHLQCFQCYLP